MSRREARVAAVEVLYGADVRSEPADALLADREGADAYCKHLVDGVCERRDEIDSLIGRHSKGWTTDRMSSVDRNVLRVATFELLEGEVPAAAAIDEAIAIAKRFSGEDAGRFVNGVLEAIRQTVQGIGSNGGGSSDGGGSDGGGSDGGGSEEGSGAG